MRTRSLTPLLALLLVTLVPRAQATPSEAAALGGLDLNYSANLDTFHFFDTDMNIYTNPALASWYRNQAQINLGFQGPGTIDGGVGINPHGLLLYSPSELVTMGIGLNRSYREFGEQAALRSVFAMLLDGSTGDVSGAFRDPASELGVGVRADSATLSPPLDVFLSFSPGYSMIGLNGYMAFGHRNMDDEALASAIDADPQQWTRDRETAKASYVTLTAGYAYDGQAFRPEVWLRYTGVSSWADYQTWGPVDAADRWESQNANNALLADHTVGLQNTSRFGLGLRGTIYAPATEITPVVTLDTASGKTFSNYRLVGPNEADAGNLTARAEDDLLKASALDLKVGVGVTWHPINEMRIIAALSAEMLRSTLTYDNLSLDNSWPGDLRIKNKWQATAWVLPLISIGAEYFPFESFGIRGSIRAATLFNRLNNRTDSYNGDPAGLPDNANDTEFADYLTETMKMSGELGNVPSLTAAIGPSIVLRERAHIDAVFGGLVMGNGGAGQLSLFSRVDLKIDWE